MGKKQTDQSWLRKWAEWAVSYGFIIHNKVPNFFKKTEIFSDRYSYVIITEYWCTIV